MAYTIENNLPSAGCIRWTNLHMQYLGTNYTIVDGYTNYIYVYWTPATPTTLVVSNTFPTLGVNDCLIFLNKSGTAVVVPSATVLNGDLIVPGSIVANAIAANTITGDKLLAGTITATQIAADAITANQIATGAVTADSLAANAIGAGAIAADAITSDKIVAGAITTAKIAANAITSNEIEAGTIQASDIKSSTITATQIAAGTITAAKIATGTITTTQLASTVGAGLDISSNTNITSRATKTEMAKYVGSRGEILVTNGTGLLGTNQNFSSFLFSGLDAYGASGSFKSGDYQAGYSIDELIPVNPDKNYRFGFYGKTNPYVGAHYYGTVSCFDADGNGISPDHTMHIGSLATLTQDLKAGDTVMKLSTTAGWNNAGNGYQRGLIAWNYVNSFGYLYPPETYSRNTYGDYTLGLWSAGGIVDGTTINLRVPWSGATIPSGTSVSNKSSGGTYKYPTNCSGIAIPNVWTPYTGVIGTTDLSGTSYGNKFHPGTAAIKIGWLINRDIAGSTVWLSNISFNIDLAIQADLDAAVTRISTAETKITPAAIVSTVRTSTEYVNDLGEKQTVAQVKSTIEQTPASVLIGFNAINPNVQNSAAGEFIVSNAKFRMKNAAAKDVFYVETGGLTANDAGYVAYDPDGKTNGGTQFLGHEIFNIPGQPGSGHEYEPLFLESDGNVYVKTATIGGHGGQYADLYARDLKLQGVSGSYGGVYCAGILVADKSGADIIAQGWSVNGNTVLGYKKYRSGLIEQFGRKSVSAAGGTVDFPIVFPTECIAVIPGIDPSGMYATSARCDVRRTNSFDWSSWQGGTSMSTGYITFFATGN